MLESRSLFVSFAVLSSSVAPLMAMTYDLTFEPPGDTSAYRGKEGPFTYWTDNTYSSSPGLYLGDDGAQKSVNIWHVDGQLFDAVSFTVEGGARFCRGIFPECESTRYDGLVWEAWGEQGFVSQAFYPNGTHFFGSQFRGIYDLTVRALHPDLGGNEQEGGAGYFGGDATDTNWYLVGSSGWCDTGWSNAYRCSLFNVTGLQLQTYDLVETPAPPALVLLGSVMAAGFLWLRHRTQPV